MTKTKIEYFPGHPLYLFWGILYPSTVAWSKIHVAIMSHLKVNLARKPKTVLKTCLMRIGYNMYVNQRLKCREES